MTKLARGETRESTTGAISCGWLSRPIGMLPALPAMTAGSARRRAVIGRPRPHRTHPPAGASSSAGDRIGPSSPDLLAAWVRARLFGPASSAMALPQAAMPAREA